MSDLKSPVLTLKIGSKSSKWRGNRDDIARDWIKIAFLR